MAILLLACAGLTTASAASLNVGAGSIATVNAAPCTTGTITTTRTQPVYFFWFFLIGYEGVRLSNIPVSCQNLPIQITAGNGEAEGTSPGATSTSIEIDMDAMYGRNTTAFSLVINGWYVPAG
jgi:hypothetical protein